MTEFARPTRFLARPSKNRLLDDLDRVLAVADTDE